MESIKDTNMIARFTSEMEEIHKERLKIYADIINTTTELSQSHRHFVKSAIDTCLKKCKDDEKMFETIQEFRKELENKNKTLKEKRRAISEVMSEVQEKEMEKEDIIQKIQKLKEEQTKRKELIESQNKANKGRLKNLQKARIVFQDHLGLEIRTVMDKTQLVKGKTLVFWSDV
uniref:SPC25, NDC80 kinetochore complex component, homolog n=2 Tax=Nothobranchius TaxID=28779 RepID=A0A1A8IFL3_NOTKU